jgi:hypothetical protein
MVVRMRVVMMSVVVVFESLEWVDLGVDELDLWRKAGSANALTDAPVNEKREHW